jgi:hypothetical protein
VQVVWVIICVLFLLPVCAFAGPLTTLDTIQGHTVVQQSEHDEWLAIVDGDVDSLALDIRAELPRRLSAPIETASWLNTKVLVDFKALSSVGTEEHLALSWHPTIGDTVVSDTQWDEHIGLFADLVTALIQCVDQRRLSVTDEDYQVNRCRSEVARVLARRLVHSSDPLGVYFKPTYSIMAGVDAATVWGGRGGYATEAYVHVSYSLGTDYDAFNFLVHFQGDGIFAVDRPRTVGGRISVGPHFSMRRGRFFAQLGPDLFLSGYGNPETSSWYLPTSPGVDFSTLFLARLFRQRVLYGLVQPSWLFGGARASGYIHEAHLEMGVGILRAFDMYLGFYRTTTSQGSRGGVRIWMNL